MEYTIEYTNNMQSKIGAEMSNVIIQWVRDNCQDLIEFHHKPLENIVKAEFKIIDSKLTKHAQNLKQSFPFIKQPKVYINDSVYIITH